jgi:hypothetical protein
LLIVSVGPSNAGKTYVLGRYVVPMLLTRPREILEMAPERFDRALIADPPTGLHPRGQYPGAVRFRDVAEWRRSARKPRVCAFEQASTDALCRLALECRNTVLVLDEFERCLNPAFPLSDGARTIVHAGRQYGVVMCGTMRRLMGVRKEARSNIQLGYFGGLREADDRKYAAATVGVNIRELENIPPPDGVTGARVFLEWAPERASIALIKVENGVRVFLRKLNAAG